MFKKFDFNQRFKFDYILFICVVFLNIMSVLMVYSASNYNGTVTYGNAYYFSNKQIVGVVMGLVSLFIFYVMRIEFLEKIKWYILAFCFLTLALIFVPGLGATKYGATRWIGIGGFTFQPSEIAKFGYIIFAASYMSKNQHKIKTFKGILPVILVGIGFCVLIILEPNMSITVCMGLLMLSLMFIGGASLKHIMVILIPILIALPLLIVIEPYRMERLMAFLDPWSSPKDEGYQLIQSLYALGSGGWFGVGLFNSRQKFNFLPFSESDFIFSIIGEELGFIGAIFIIVIYLIIIYRGILIAISATNRFHSFFASGITAIIGIQVAVNIAVVTGTIPPTGLPLPFMSSGSTSIIAFMGAVGILLNISNKNKTFGVMQIEPKFIVKKN